MKQQNDKIQELMEDNHRLLSTISTLKRDLKATLWNLKPY